MTDLKYYIMCTLAVLIVLLVIQEHKCYKIRKRKHDRGEYLDLRGLKKDIN